MTKNQVVPLMLDDGYIVETVLYGTGTLCVSSQAGCRMGCPFCASGRKGLVRGLTTAEMHAQLALHQGVKRVTVSGIGEPLDNIDVTEEFIKACPLPVSVTTSVPDVSVLARLMDASHNGVMLSLHAGTEDVHRKLVPKSAPLDDIFDSLSEKWTAMSSAKRRKIGFNYLLIKDVNDDDAQTEAFLRRVVPFKGATVHLLSCNPVEKSPYTSPDIPHRDRIYDKMCSAGMNVRRANTWRRQSDGGCGTLFLRGLKKTC
jgi:23S rRNA (adenine2503-C2)-methyltransferase